MRALSSLAILALGGCDFVFGVTGQPEPCELASFEAAQPVTIVEADAFSVDWDQTLAVVEHRGLLHELALPDGTPAPIEVDAYSHTALALTPEGDALLYTISVEPYELKGALRTHEAAWQLDAPVPPGTFAGTPSADAFGPRRVLVRALSTTLDVQEFVVDDRGRWAPIGSPLRVPGDVSPNLTPNGLTMVFATVDAEGTPGIFAASRDDVDSPFGEPVVLRTGQFRTPQLCGRCQQLYAIADGMLVRLDR